jgi:hypothetical protein
MKKKVISRGKNTTSISVSAYPKAVFDTKKGTTASMSAAKKPPVSPAILRVMKNMNIEHKAKRKTGR